MMETEFAGCLLMVGPPDVIGSGETEAQRCKMWDGDVQPTDDYESDPCSWHATKRVGEILDGPISSLGYRRKCEAWWNDYVLGKRVPYFDSSKGVQEGFDAWWLAYKTWLLENQRGA